MISAEKARESTKIAQAEENARIKATVEQEVEAVCEVISQRARGGNNTCEFDDHAFKYPKIVAVYLQDELGYTTNYNPNNGALKVSW